MERVEIKIRTNVMLPLGIHGNLLKIMFSNCNNLTFGLAIENLFAIRYVASYSERADIAQGNPFAITGSVKVKF